MSLIYWRNHDETSTEPVTVLHPLPVQTVNIPTVGSTSIPVTADLTWRLSLEGRIFISSDGDQNDYVTGQTSFANTTPTFLLHNPAGSDRLIIPLYYQLSQAGTVAGGDINVDTEIVAPSAWASGGTAEKILNSRPGMSGRPAPHGIVYSNPTATAGYGIAIGHATLAADVSPAEGIINIYEWQPPAGTMLDPGTSLNVFTYAGTTGPTWGWVFAWAEMPLAWL